MATIETVRKEFREIYDTEYERGISMPDAYEEAEKKFFAKYQHRAYSNFNSFNVAKFQKTKRELKK